MFMKILLTTLVVLLFFTVALAQNDESQLTGQIAFASENDIYVMNADGTERVQLTTDPAADFDPVWSPDGTKIAFRSHRDDGNEEIYVMDVDGSNQINLTNDPEGDWSPAWSPDGTKIAFASARDGSANDLYIMNPDGTDVEQITDIPGINEYPSWSPDSNQIVFHCTFGHLLASREGDFEICIVDLATLEITQLTDTPGTNKQPAWSPDGTKIAFESTRNGWPTLPDYTPLGYDGHNYGDEEIYIMDVDGSNQVNVTNNPREGEAFPAWAPDGHLIFSRYGCLMIIDPATPEVEPIQITTAELCADQFADWYQGDD